MSNSKTKLNTPSAKANGSVLIVVIWIVLVLASMVLVLAHHVRTEALAAANYTSLAEAESVALGGIQYVLAMVSSADDPEDSTNSYEQLEVGDGYFWVLKPNLSDDEDYQFGLTDEAAKININEADSELLLNLPEMTTEFANSLIDWRDENSEVTTGGAEDEYYLLLSDPYECKNAPLETIEEVLLIKGASLDMLYGEDTNRNGILDWNENDGDNASPDDNSNSSLDSGFFNYVTIHSYEPNSGSGQNQLINVSSNNNRSQLIQLMTEQLGQAKALEIMSPLSLRNFDSIIEFYYYLGIKKEDFAKIIDRITITDDQIIPGRVNINTAPEEVLLCLPGLEQTDVDKLIKERSQANTDTRNILWITDVLTQQKAEAIGKYITSKTYQYSADIVAVSDDGRAFCRYYVIIDTAGDQPQVIYKQSLSQLGFPLDPDILENLRDSQQL